MKKSNKKSTVIGWIGSPSTAKYIESIEFPLRYLSKIFDIQFIALGTEKKIIDQRFCTFRAWNRKRESKLLQDMDFGVMPLHTGPWEEGKCAYKIIQYLGNGKPCVASPTEFNRYLLKESKGGYLAKNGAGWIEMMKKLICDPVEAKKMGIAGKKFINKKFSPEKAALKVVNALQLVDCL